MKSLSWTKSEIASAFAGCGTLKDIVTRLETELSAQGEVVCAIRVNDIALSEEDEVKFADCSIDDLQSLTIESHRPIDLVTGALKSAVQMVPALETSALTTAELLRAGEAQRAARGFQETVAGCQWLVETLHHVRGASAGIGQPILCMEQWLESEKVIGRVVNDVSDAHARMDTILMADLLEYEMTAALASWKSTIQGELDGRPDANP
jgi:hypothetical protein